jgi:hypothetical protein
MKKKQKGIDVRTILQKDNKTYLSFAQISKITGISIWMIDWHRRHNDLIDAEYYNWTVPNLSTEKIPGLSLVGCFLLIMRDDSKEASEFQLNLAKMMAQDSFYLNLKDDLLNTAI